MAKTRIKLSCAAIIDRACVPFAVVVADVKVGKETVRYVLLEHETRVALSHMCEQYSEINTAIRCREGRDAFPELIRTHAFDASGVLSDDLRLRDRQGSWASAETLWVRADLAPIVLEKLAAWRERFPQRSGSIWAPSWLALTGIQALAIAAGVPMPASEAA